MGSGRLGGGAAAGRGRGRSGCGDAGGEGACTGLVLGAAGATLSSDRVATTVH